MPYGHVESDIYNEIGNLKRYEVSTSSLIIKNSFLNSLSNSFSDVDASYKSEIDLAIENLRKENTNLINETALDLVDLSHTYFSWKYSFNIARENHRYSEAIPVQLIKDEPKFFILNY